MDFDGVFCGDDSNWWLVKFGSTKLIYLIFVFTLQLLNRSAADRLGSGPNEECDIKLHAFYRMIDWHKLVNKEVQPPFKPKIVRNCVVSCLVSCVFACYCISVTPSCCSCHVWRMHAVSVSVVIWNDSFTNWLTEVHQMWFVDWISRISKIVRLISVMSKNSQTIYLWLQ